VNSLLRYLSSSGFSLAKVLFRHLHSELAWSTVFRPSYLLDLQEYLEFITGIASGCHCCSTHYRGWKTAQLVCVALTTTEFTLRIDSSVDLKVHYFAAPSNLNADPAIASIATISFSRPLTLSRNPVVSLLFV
jgi:hypothetical protein